MERKRRKFIYSASSSHTREVSQDYSPGCGEMVCFGVAETKAAVKRAAACDPSQPFTIEYFKKGRKTVIRF